MGQRVTYREQFRDEVTAREYDEREYGKRSYADLLWRIEQQQLAQLLSEFRRNHPTIKLLDFATGSGRILSFVENLVDESSGIEISESMAQRARTRVKRSPIYCQDITSPSARVEGRYDVITAFRFVLNAESDLRQAAFSSLRERLRDDSSVIVFNNHGNLWSHKAILYPLHCMHRGAGPRTSGNYMSHRQVLKVARDAGLTAQRVYGCGVLGGRLAGFTPWKATLSLEEKLTNTVLCWAAVNQMYIARRAAPMT
jgi:hypothetical protein